MSIPFFNDVLAALGKKLNYESISNLYGNSFCKDAGKYIQEANPLLKTSAIGNGFAEVLGRTTVVKSTSKKKTEAALKKSMGDLSWAEGLL
jgi:hypothetical protein